MSKKGIHEPIYELNLSEHGRILYVCYSPYEWSQDLLLIAFPRKILAAKHVKDYSEIEIIANLKHEPSCTAIISSETALNVIPLVLEFCTAGMDFKIRICKSDLDKTNTCEELSGHSNYINDISYDSENNYIASVSDDHTARIWKTENKMCTGILKLTSPGMSVRWHKEDASKLLVAEKNGIIRFYNVDTQTPILSLHYYKPLSCADWAPFNSQLVGSLNAGELILWNLSQSNQPMSIKLLHTDNGGDIKFCPVGNLVASVNKLDNSLKIININSQEQRLQADVVCPTNVTWHFRQLLVCVGDNSMLRFWKVVNK